MEDLKLGIKLKSSISSELELMNELERVGKRTGLPKQWLLRGFKQAMLEEQGYVFTVSRPSNDSVVVKKEDEPKQIVEKDSISSSFSNYMMSSKK